MTVADGIVMDTTPIAAAEVAAIEAAEARAWIDLYGAAPADFAASVGLGSDPVGTDGVALRWAATGRRYFSRAIGLGVTEPATPELIDEIIGRYERAGIEMFLLQSMPACAPVAYSGWLAERGLEPFDAQDRIVRGAQPLRTTVPDSGRGLAAERVGPVTTEEWAAFLQDVYGLEGCEPWLHTLPGRAGWHQYVVREEGRIVAARAMHIAPDGFAWLGMDGPVPGLRTDDFEPDAVLCRRIVQDGLERGVRCFLADIEAPSAALDTPAYDAFATLGFTRPYVRTHHAHR